MLARFLAGSENAVFHCFKSLYTENLLYQQAEIVHLSGELGTLRNKDRSSTDDLEKMFHRNWAALRSSSTTGESGNSHGSQGGNMQLQKIKELQTALDRYCKMTIHPLPLSTLAPFCPNVNRLLN